MTNKKIETKQEMVELLTSYGWNKSGMFNENMMSQDGQYIELFNDNYLSYGIGDVVRCELEYPVQVIEGQMDAYDFGEYATIEAPNMKIRLQKNGATVQVKR